MARDRFIDIRKLAALQLYYRGQNAKMLEFGFAVFVLGGLGFVSVFLSPKHSLVIEVVGVYLFFIGVNYVPLLLYGAAMVRAKAVKSEALADRGDPAAVRRQYGVQQVLLMVPLSIPLLAIRQEAVKRRANDQ